MKNTIALIFFSFIIILFSPVTNAQTANDHIDKAQNEYDASKYKEALQDFSQAQVDKPDEAKLKYNIGNTLYRLSDFKKAFENFSSALKDKSSPQLKSKIYYNLANASYKKR